MKFDIILIKIFLLINLLIAKFYVRGDEHTNNNISATITTTVSCRTQNMKYNSHPRNNTITGDQTKEILIGFLAGYYYSKVSLGALPLAVEDINKNSQLLPGRKLNFKAVDIGRKTSTLRSLPIKLMTEMRDNNVVAFIGPDETCTSEALVSAAWNLPMISYKCADTAVSDKNVFHSFARTLAPASKVSKSVVALLKAFHWEKFVIVAGVHPAWGSEIAQAIKILAESRNLTVIQHKEYSDYIPSHISEMQKIVDETYRTARIYVFVGEHIAMVDFVRCLQNRKLLESGDYMVISVDDEIYDPARRSNIVEREYLDPYLKRVRSRALELQSFLSVLKLTPSFPLNPKFDEICENIRLFSRRPPFLMPYHERIFGNITVPIYGAHLYDAVTIYARAATEILQEGGNIMDGQLVMSKIFNRSYHSILGFDVYIDSNGDAEGNFTVIALQEDSSVHQNTNNNNSTLKLSMQQVGYFVYNKPGDIPEFRYIDKNRPIRWIKGIIPRAEPICGFHGEFCTPKNKDWRLLLSAVFVALFLAVAGAFLIKHYRYEQTLACLLWKVDLKEVTLISNENQELTMRSKNRQSCRHSIVTGADATKRAYTNIGVYRGNIVAVKRIHKRSIDLTRTIRKELKQMRELRHENIITFIGASVDTNAIAILTSYCARGSLEDVLANEDLFLDLMFISSLISDILKGMIYLHESEIISHGNLRSSNCLVDSRWVCQITDFGLHEFKLGQEEPIQEKLEERRNLWRAPELLRHLNHHPRGTQKGDIYSLGILLYEIIGRSGPWGDTDLTNNEIITRVRNSIGPNYFRPPVRNLNAPDYVKQCLRLCWDEDPDVRPDIRLVRVKLKELQAGLKPNIFDNMLAIMEKYAYNLEGLVQERTTQLYEEKKKTEALLHRMLPKTVAESLKRGERVEAECFDCVTIFFSDLVGFTELCAQSTPFEVVEMLNDLYTCCDSIISNYDVYKVETIGDAYMVVSGLPIRNRDRHAGEIASLALHLLDKVSNLEIRHRPGELLQIRIGIHSGQCVAGVVGLKMPRYCLFGDTVNTASRMESSGEALKIHISAASYILLKKIGGYKCEERGLTYIKGKGEMRTYWLKAEDFKRKLERIAARQNYYNYHDAPDLIRNEKTPPCPQASPSSNYRNSMFSLNHNGNKHLSIRSFSSSASQASNDDCRLPLMSLPDVNNQELFDDCCYYCQKRKILSLMEADNEKSTTHCKDCAVFHISARIKSVAEKSSPAMAKCLCKHPITMLRDVEIGCGTRFLKPGKRNRSPRSAPHITFMQ